jgi:hypothetical protein
MEEEQKFELTAETLKEPMTIGDIFAKSGMFPDVKSQAQAVVKILAGRELGVSPFESMTNIYMVNGKLAIMSKLMAAILKRSKKYDYEIEKIDEKECIICFFSLNGERKLLGKSVFNFQDAARAGLANKDVWKNYPRNMLYSRALANGIRWFCPDSICGYALEEIDDIVIEPVKTTVEIATNGEVVNG